MIQIRRHVIIPDFMSVRVMAPQAAVDWWLSGGINAANAIVVYQPKGAASYAASLVNLANPGTYDAYAGSAPTWAAGTGWTFNGSTQYLYAHSSGFSDLVSNGAYTFCIRFACDGNVSVRQAIFADWDAAGANHSVCAEIGGYLQTAAHLTTTQRRTAVGTDYLDSGESAVSTVLVNVGVTWLGVISLTRNIYTDGVFRATDTPNVMANGTQLAIGRGGLYNALYFTGRVIAMSIYDTVLSGAQVTAVHTAMAAL